MATAELKVKVITHDCRIVCLCGSTKFVDDFERANLRETLAGNVVLSIGSHRTGDDVLLLTKEQKSTLDRLHLQKIDMADEVIVINTGGYIGHSTRDEVLYAWKKGKPVRFEFADAEVLEITLHNLWNWYKAEHLEGSYGVHTATGTTYRPISRGPESPHEGSYPRVYPGWPDHLEGGSGSSVQAEARTEIPQRRHTDQNGSSPTNFDPGSPGQAEEQWTEKPRPIHDGDRIHGDYRRS